MALPASEIDVGKIKLVWRGVYSGSTGYTVDDLVYYNDGNTVSTYINISNSTGEVPSTSGTVNSTYWNSVVLGADPTSAGTEPGTIQYRDSSGFGGMSLFQYVGGTSSVLGIANSSPTRTVDVGGNMDIMTDLKVVGLTTLGITTTQVVDGDFMSVQEVMDAAECDLGTANGTSNLDLKTYGSVFLFNTNSSGTWTHNLRGDGSTTFNNMMSMGETITVTVVSKQSNSSYYTNALNIDGSGQTIYWRGDTATAYITPSDGSSGNYDFYTWNIIKTGSGSFVVFGAQSKSVS